MLSKPAAAIAKNILACLRSYFAHFDRFVFDLWIVIVFTGLNASPVSAERLHLQEHDSIVILGNTFAERMQLFGYFETFLHSQFPGHCLKVRNMGWSADEIDLMVRPLGFPKLFDELKEHETDVILICLGVNESFKGPEHVEQFGSQMAKFITNLRRQKFNGESPPHIVLISPIAHEDLPGDLPNAGDRNKTVKLYVDALVKAAKEQQTGYVDLFTPTLNWTENGGNRALTFNGTHLTEYGDWAVGQIMARSLGMIGHISGPAADGNPVAESLRRTVYEKNYQYFNWWHPPNASYIHGRRNKTPGAKHLEWEREQQARLITACDEMVWVAVKPKPHEVWQQLPVDGKPIWFPTPADKPIPDATRQAQLAIADDGDGDKQFLLTPEEQIELFTVPEGYQVNLYASEVRFPIANPMAIQFDARGRLWVANTPTWPHALPGKQPKDSIVILEDSDRDGVADKHIVFLDNMNLIHGFALAGGDAYVAQAPFLILARDTDGDDEADWFRVVLHGFGAEDAEHAMNNFRWSPGGSIYFTQGIFYHTQVETPYGPVRVRDAAVFRYRPYEARCEVFVSHQLWNPYGSVFGRWGRGIVLDASAGQYYPMDVLSANYVYPKGKERADHLSFGPSGSIAAGCDFLHSSHFPPDVQGRFLVNHCEGEVGTHWYTLKPRGTNYEAERHKPSLLTSEDRTFRPVAMAIGPDGALYVADFYSHIFENVNFSKRHPGRDHSHGRIWRISFPGRSLLQAPKVAGAPIPELLELLKAYESTARDHARRELQARGRAAVVPHLRRWVASLKPTEAEYEHQLTEALWVYQSVNELDLMLLKRLLSAKAPGARVAATQVLRFWQQWVDRSLDLIRRQIDDSDARVRLHAVLACGFSNSDQAIETALEAADHELDPGLEHALNRTIDYLEQQRHRQ